MNALEAIKARRSVRSFEPLPVRTADVRNLLDAAVHAPSALNGQPWAFAVVQDRELLQRPSLEGHDQSVNARMQFVDDVEATVPEER